MRGALARMRTRTRTHTRTGTRACGCAWVCLSTRITALQPHTFLLVLAAVRVLIISARDLTGGSAVFTYMLHVCVCVCVYVCVWISGWKFPWIFRLAHRIRVLDGTGPPVSGN